VRWSPLQDARADFTTFEMACPSATFQASFSSCSAGFDHRFLGGGGSVFLAFSTFFPECDHVCTPNQAFHRAQITAFIWTGR